MRAEGNGHSTQLVNPLIDNDLGGSWRWAYPTPAAKNTAVYAENMPPQIRQVKHNPKQPKSGEISTITTKVSDPDGIQYVKLQYQDVAPGNYIRHQYSDGSNNRHLIRYRILVKDNTEIRLLQMPYPDDPQPNFAYFVYDGVPAWSGADRPGMISYKKSVGQREIRPTQIPDWMYIIISTGSSVVEIMCNSSHPKPNSPILV